MGTPFFGNDWEGRVVEGRFPLLEWRGGSDSSGSFFTVLSGLQQATIQLILASDPEADAHLAQWNFATGLSHPHIAKVLAAGRCVVDGTELVYAVTESSDATLSRIIRSGTLGPVRTGEVFVPVLNALSYLHQNGVVHGHINPSTIEFACAKPKLSIANLVLAGSVKRRIAATGLYDAPEVLHDGATQASDAWSIAITMYEAITDAQLSFDSADNERAQIVQTLPSPFREIVEGCLQVDPERRFNVENIFSRLDKADDAPTSKVDIPVTVENTTGASPLIQASQRRLGDEPDVCLPTETAIEEPVVFSKSFERFEEAHLTRFRGLSYAVVSIIVLAMVSVVVLRGHKSTARPPELRRKIAAPLTSEPIASKPLIAPAAVNAAPENQSSFPAPQVVDHTRADIKRSIAEDVPQSTSHTETATAYADQQLMKTRPVGSNVSKPETNGTVIKRVLPDVASGAFDGNPVLVEAQVRVSVDKDGAVSNVECITPGPGNYFARIAERAARSWQFKPPMQDGKPDRSVWVLRFYFARNQTEATAERQRGL
jgi:TonB family protein